MKKKYFIFAFTFLSILTGLQSYGQGIDSGDNVKTIIVKLNIPLGAIDSINKLNPKSFINIDDPKPDTDVEVKLSISNVVTTTSSSNTTSSQTSTSYYSFPIDYSRLQSVPSTSICWVCDLDNDSSYSPPTSSITLPNSAVAKINDNTITYGWDNINNFFHIDYVLSSSGNNLSSSTQWYLDKDGDGFEGETATGSTKPAGDGWIQGSSRGTDCDDTKWSYDNVDCSEKKTWYLDEDNDGYYSQVQQAELNPGTGWKEAPVSGIDCNDAKHSLTNDCSIPDPCAEIKNVVNYKGRYSGNDLKTNINYLKGVVDRGEANKKEEGYVIRKMMNLDGTYNSRCSVLPTGSEEKLPLKVGGYVVGAFHSHTYKGDPMYSFGDLKYLLNLYDKAIPSNRRDVFLGLVAQDAQDNNNVYILKVDDIEKLRSQIKTVEESEKYLNLNPNDRLEKIHEEQALLYHKSNGQKEKSFLQQFPNAGISIYKANADVSNFSKLTLNNDNVIPTSCN